MKESVVPMPLYQGIITTSATPPSATHPSGSNNSPIWCHNSESYCSYNAATDEDFAPSLSKPDPVRCIGVWDERFSHWSVKKTLPSVVPTKGWASSSRRRWTQTWFGLCYLPLQYPWPGLSLSPVPLTRDFIGRGGCCQDFDERR